MKLNEFMKNLYYGHSGCKMIVVDGWNECVKIQLDSVFIMKCSSFDYLVDEEVKDGFLVFEGVIDLSWVGRFIPNDVVNSITCSNNIDSQDGKCFFNVSINHVGSGAQSHETVLSFGATNVSIERT